ncbi:hypothetical protein ACVDG5_013405 [Mesorhizobium sp. ORM6]
MTDAIRLYWGRFGHVSVLNVASDFVTHAHVEAHLIIWLEGTAGEMTIGRETVRLGPCTAAGINSFQPHSHVLSQNGTPGLFLAFYIDPDWARRRRDLPPPRRCLPRRRSRSSRGCTRRPPACSTT